MRKANLEKIIVVGAGVAGMTAAQLLQHSGLEVTVLEGLDRVGGRVFPIQLGDNYIDTGATWIHFHDGNPLTALAQKKDWNIVEDNYEPFEIWNSETKKWLGDEKFHFMKLSEKVRTEAIDFFLKNNEEASTEDFFNNFIANKNWDEKTVQIVKFLYAALLETDYSGNISQIALTDERYLNTFNKDGENAALIVGGYKPMIDELSQGLDIRLNETVQKVDYQKDKILITTQNLLLDISGFPITNVMGYYVVLAGL